MAISKLKLYLFFAGAILLLVGVYIGFSPTHYLAGFFGQGEFSSDSLSEMRGMGGLLFTLGLFVAGGAFFERIKGTALILSALIFGAFSVFRFFGVLLDGIPSESILMALAIEVIFAAMAAGLLIWHARQPSGMPDAR